MILIGSETKIIKEVHDTIVILRELNADEKVKNEAYYREKRLHDEAFALGYARREGLAEGRAEVIEQMKKSGMTEEHIQNILNN